MKARLLILKPITRGNFAVSGNELVEFISTGIKVGYPADTALLLLRDGAWQVITEMERLPGIGFPNYWQLVSDDFEGAEYDWHCARDAWYSLLEAARIDDLDALWDVASKSEPSSLLDELLRKLDELDRKQSTPVIFDKGTCSYRPPSRAVARIGGSESSINVLLDAAGRVIEGYASQQERCRSWAVKMAASEIDDINAVMAEGTPTTEIGRFFYRYYIGCKPSILRDGEGMPRMDLGTGRTTERGL